MKTLSIDIETYSDINLAKCGVYRYCESPAFEILLFAYSADGEPVQVVDLACGEKLPEEVKAALTDEAVTKYAFNASFERICLSRFLGLPTGEYLEPESWRCTMVWAATMGLPLSLEGVGTVLGLEKQKLTEGKELIKYFCQPCTPTKSNGQRTRNKPFHAPDKWSDFKRYNLRDVEVEMAIQQRLSKFPVSGSVWAEYHIDQEINDRGVALDLTLVQAAIEMDTHSRKELRPLVDAWRQANPKIVEFWWAVDRAVMEAVRYKHTNEAYGITFSCRSGMLFITLPFGRNLAYVKPKVGTNKFGGDCITYEGVGATKKWERLDSYGPKFVENIVQALSRDILCYAMKTLRCCSIVMHIHDELVIEADPRMSLAAVCEQMGRTPPWAKGLLLRADGYETAFYKKD